MTAYFKKEHDYAKTDDPKEYDKLMCLGYQVIAAKEYKKGMDNERAFKTSYMQGITNRP